MRPVPSGHPSFKYLFLSSHIKVSELLGETVSCYTFLDTCLVLYQRWLLACVECVLCAFGQMLELALEVVSAWCVPGWGVQGSRVVTCAGGTMPSHMGWILVWQEMWQLWGIPSTLLWYLRQSSCGSGCDHWFGKRLLETLRQGVC